MENTFGDQGNPKLNNRKTVQLFVKFLSDLVPYEPPEYLKVIVRNVSGIYFGGAFNANYWKRERLAFIHVG